MEKWKNIIGFEDRYKISDTGKVMSIKNNIILKPKISSEYWAVQLCKNKASTTKRIHRLVALHFIPNPSNKPQVNHKDTDKLNNHVGNLEWSTREENMKHAFDNGLIEMPDISGAKNGKSKITEEQAKEILKLFGTKKVIDIAKQFGISKQSVWDIKAKRSWKHL